MLFLHPSLNGLIPRLENTMRILITGGAGFVGSNLAIKLKGKYPNYSISTFDNLSRRGSELNLPLLRKHGVDFIHGDIRMESDLAELTAADIVIDASADPSVLSGIQSATIKSFQSNLFGTINLLEWATKLKSKFIFLSTSRVYPFGLLNDLVLEETNTRFQLASNQTIAGVSSKGITTDFPLTGSRSIYGAAKLSSELIIQEYMEFKNLDAAILRCGVIAGPGQFGKVDQGVLVFWIASHYWKKKLSYFGYGGQGKQVRDLLHIDDLFDLLDKQIHNFNLLNKKISNVGGGLNNSASLMELTQQAKRVTGNKLDIGSVNENRVADIPYYITDNTLVEQATGWKPQKNITNLTDETFRWIKDNEVQLKEVLF
jgi:CDP-paratose 2-epimerase